MHNPMKQSEEPSTKSILKEIYLEIARRLKTIIEKALRLGAADLFHTTIEADGSSG